ncbi:MAG: HAD family hydrolase [Phycisphaerales bacterium]|nr:MAG: HAD family hydrolase [Phycisphaerales bacterium]
MLQQYGFIIWDWNGTLLDDARLCLEIVNEMLAARGKRRITYERYQEEFDFPVQQFYQRLGLDFSTQPFDTFASDYITRYDERCLTCNLQDHARDVLQHCQDMGIAQSVLSAYYQAGLERMVDFFNVRHYFANIAGLDNYHAASKVQRGKWLTEQSGVDSDKVLLVGDTVHDHEVAKAIGADCVLIVSGHQLKERLEGCGVPVLESLAEFRPR